MRNSQPLDCILLVDDDPIVILLFDSLLKEMKVTKRIVATSDPNEALTLLTTLTPDLILVDVVMPEINGFEFISKIRSSFNFDPTKLVVISSYLNHNDIRKLEDMEINKIIIKPLTEEKMLAVL